MQTSAENHYSNYEKVSCTDLRAGMYVQELDRPWLDSPFMFQGFYISSDEDIEALQECCEYVFINKALEETDSEVIHTKVASQQSTTPHVKAIASKAGGKSRYPDTVTVEKELETARKVYEESRESIKNIFATAISDGVIDLLNTRKTTSDIVDSVLRNPDAFMLLQRIKNKDHHKFTHAINCCAVAATFCRHLGFSKAEIQDISMGALLLDIGITKLPSNMIDTSTGLNPLAMKLVRHHVNFGLEILDNTPDLPSITRDMVLTHHERVNGKGYPNGLESENIPVCGRIAAIVDCYDAMISNRPYKEKVSPTEAVCSMYNWRNIDFHEDLIEQFIHCIGAYPTGSLVELNSGQIGIVMSQNRVRRLFPKILLILNADKVSYERPTTVDLDKYLQKTNGKVLDIKGVVDADELGIDPSYYYL
jgi:HD-GYP domain-containing protein (c-di-GMP phosphodiesterase class II)